MITSLYPNESNSIGYQGAVAIPSGARVLKPLLLELETTFIGDFNITSLHWLKN